MKNYIKRIQAKGVHGRLDFDLEFFPVINIIHAQNGAGKTTLLHILANALNGNFARFAHLKFRQLQIIFANGQIIDISRTGKDQDAKLSVLVDKKALYQDVPVTSRAVIRGQISSSGEPIYDEHVAIKSREKMTNAEFDPILTATYFPAFRTMIEAWANAGEKDPYTRGRSSDELAEIEYEIQRLQKEPIRRVPRFQVQSTYEARRAFGEFVPIISYPSPNEIRESLEQEVQRAFLIVGNKDSELFSQVVIDVFKVFSKSGPGQSSADANQILSDIQKISSEDYLPSVVKFLQQSSFLGQDAVYSQLAVAFKSIQLEDNAREFAAPILDVYRKLLQERDKSQRSAFEQIERYLKSINDFFQEKTIEIRVEERRNPRIGIRFQDQNTVTGLRALSSGERQIITLIYAATKLSTQQVVLIDEPELSLHIDWQRILLEKMSEQIGDRQIIVCTHSPSIAGDYLSNMIELKPTYTNIEDSESVDNEDEETGF